MRRKINEHEERCKEYYDVLIEALRYVAYRCGYALTVHGSLKRDIDLVACPWRESAVDAEYLIEKLREATLAIIGIAREREVDKGSQPEKKPCGRLAWAFYLTPDDDDNGVYLDISVMPKGEKE